MNKSRIGSARTKCCYVYVIEGGRQCKVGVSTNPRSRFRALRAEGARRLVCSWYLPGEAYQIEKQAHRILEKGGPKRFGDRTEWFLVSAEEAVNAVEKAIEMGPQPKSPAVPFDADRMGQEYRDKLKRLEAEYEEWLAQGGVEPVAMNV